MAGLECFCWSGIAGRLQLPRPELAALALYVELAVKTYSRTSTPLGLIDQLQNPASIQVNCFLGSLFQLPPVSFPHSQNVQNTATPSNQGRPIE
jgi:hypothetical protein